jgi:diguanylate cyclase (GGDEF)-like protein/PAS domain S-box-containing protein
MRPSQSSGTPEPGVSAIDLNGWHEPSRRVRRLQLLQGVALLSVCLASVIMVLVLGSAILQSVSTQQRVERELRELADVRNDGLQIQSVVWKARATGKLGASPDTFGAYAEFRNDTIKLLDADAGGDSPNAVVGRQTVRDGIAEIDRLAADFLSSSQDRRADGVAVMGTDEISETIDAGIDQWLNAATVEADAAAARASTLWRNLLWIIVGLLGGLGILGLILWFGLEKARARLMATLQSSEERFRSLVQNSSDAVMIVDAQGVIRYASQPATTLFDIRPVDLIGRPLAELVHDDDFSPMSRIAQRGTTVLDTDEPIEWQVRTTGGEDRYVETVCSHQLDDATLNGYVLNTRDITERRGLEAALTHRAFHDPLTDLANRDLFMDRVQHALSLRVRQNGEVAIVMLDLDDFKIVNDSLGHAAGDLLLIEVAKRLGTTLRSTDTAARLGGDEFAVLIEMARDVDEVCGLAERIIGSLTEPIILDGREIVVRASLGIALAHHDEEPATELLRDADVAMYVAKGRGRGGYAVFDPSMAESASNRMALTTELQRALQRGQLSLVYQPIVSLDSHRPTAVEALMRWTHPEHGSIEPIVFIPIAEETGLIVPFGAWAIRTAATDALSWDWEGADQIQVSVNVAVRQLEHPGFVEVVRSALADTGFPARRLTLEITESDVMRDSELILEQLNAVKQLGVTIAIDDFGTGYSSLSYLAKLPIDLVKIDRSFVSGLANGHRDGRIASMIVGIGESLGLRTIAEGVEELEQVDELRELGCTLAQGFYFSKPLAASELHRTFAQRSPVSA